MTENPGPARGGGLAPPFFVQNSNGVASRGIRGASARYQQLAQRNASMFAARDLER